MHITDNHILVAHRRNTGYWYSTIIPKHNPVQDYNSYSKLTLVENSRVESAAFEYKTGDAFKFSYTLRGSQYFKYYDISSGDYRAITQAEYDEKTTGSQYPILQKFQIMYNATGSDSDYQNVQCWVSNVDGILTVLTLSGISDATRSSIYYHLLSLTDSSLIVYQQGASSGVYILDYAYKKDSDFLTVGPKQVVPATYTVRDDNFYSLEVGMPLYSVNTIPVMHGIVTAKIDATHVIVAS